MTSAEKGTFVSKVSKQELDVFHAVFEGNALSAPLWWKPDENGKWPDESPPTADLVETYVRYADVLEAPPEMHKAVMEQFIAAVLNRNGVTIRHGSLSYTLDLWQVLLSGSGFGRSTLIGLSQPILEKAGLSRIERTALWGSPQALFQDIAQNPCAFWMWGEMSERLKLFNRPRFEGAKQWLTDRYDNRKLPDPVTYRRTGLKDRDTPSIVFPGAPRLNILATSSEEWFFSNLLQEDSTGGFIPRWMLIRAEESGRDIPTPQEPDSALVVPLAEHLRRVLELKGEADLSEILEPYSRWYSQTKRRFESQPNRALAMAFFNRHRVHVLKLVVIYEVSANLSLKVSLASWERAVRKAKQLEEIIFALLETGMSTTGYARSQMVERVKNAGAEGLSRSAFTRAFQQTPRQQREDFLATLVQAETVVGFVRYTQGRTATILVHRDFVAEYRKAHPGDQVITDWSKS